MLDWLGEWYSKSSSIPHRSLFLDYNFSTCIYHIFQITEWTTKCIQYASLAITILVPCSMDTNSYTINSTLMYMLFFIPYFSILGYRAILNFERPWPLLELLLLFTFGCSPSQPFLIVSSAVASTLWFVALKLKNYDITPDFSLTI